MNTPAEPILARFERERAAYLGGYDPRLLAALARREAIREAAFFVPYLRPEMSVLDCGCGPGGISLGLAALIPEGSVTGVDIEPDQLERGRAEARQRGFANLRFEQASLYQLPFPDATFDAVLAHAVMYHLDQPMAALREIRRVLKPGGLVGLRDADIDGDVYFPGNPLLERFWAIAAQVAAAGGGDIRFGRRQRAVLRECGFEDVRASASYDCFGDAPAVSGFSRYWADVFIPKHRETILTAGWATAEELEWLAEAMRTWGQHPDALYARCRCEAVGVRGP
jgi:SAM-dependent methyltransferase